MWTVLLISLATNRNRYYVVGDESCYTSISIPYTPHQTFHIHGTLCFLVHNSMSLQTARQPPPCSVQPKFPRRRQRQVAESNLERGVVVLFLCQRTPRVLASWHVKRDSNVLIQKLQEQTKKRIAKPPS
jgi:hypothetical protein